LAKESQLDADKSDGPCEVSAPKLLNEHKEDIKKCIDIKIERFSKDPYETLKEAGTYEIIEYLIKIGIEYIDLLYKSRPDEAKPLIEGIWIYNRDYVNDLFSRNRFGPKDIIITIRSILRDREYGNLFENLLIFTDAVGMMEKHFKSNEVILYQLRSELSNLHNRGIYERTVVSLPSDEIMATPVSRGDLKVEVEVSKPLIVAGEQFSVFVNVTNPFEKPVIIYSVETMIPSELVSINEMGNSSEKEIGVAEGFATIDRDYLRKGIKPMPYILQPDDRICKQIVLKTRGKRWDWLAFTPVRLILEIQVRYGVDYRTHLDTVKTELDIQVGLKAIMVGAIFGGILGGFVRMWSDQKYDFGLSNLAYIALSIVFSAMAVVAFARRTGVQKIVSIEDFFGGLLIGFYVGFQGPEWAWKLISGEVPGGNETVSVMVNNSTPTLKTAASSILNNSSHNATIVS